MSATDNLGAHLLGWSQSTPDERDWPLESFLGGTPTALDLALAVALPWHSEKMQKWMKLVTAAAQGTPVPPTPTPTPTPPPAPPSPSPAGAVLWLCPERLDQGQTPHCGGFGSAQWCNILGSENVDDHFTNADGDRIYYEAKAIDGEPKQENGTSGRSCMTALRNDHRIAGYANANALNTIKQWILTKGPVGFGSNWYEGMFTPDNTGHLLPSGTVKGGHWYVLNGYDPSTDDFTMLNSWGPSWGQDGMALMHGAVVGRLLGEQGEAYAAVELPL
jgi:hypothetical protein